MVIEPLSSSHDRSTFDCGEPSLNDYLQRLSNQHDKKGLGRTFVAIEENDLRVKGYYTISSSTVSFESVPDNLPRHPIPVILLGRLAVDLSMQRRGIGGDLLIHAFKQSLKASELLGVYAIAVDALNQSAKNFYLNYGFKELRDDELHLYMQIKMVRKLNL